MRILLLRAFIDFAAAAPHSFNSGGGLLQVTDLSVSVALATFNGENDLPNQLADLANQTRLPAELVVSDDASSDETISVLQEFAATAPFPVQIYRNHTRLGFRENFVRCAAACNSDLIAFCDQDDRWSANKVELVTSCFADAEVQLVFHNAKVVIEGYRAIGTLYPTSWPRTHCKPLHGPPWGFSPGFTQTFRRELLGFNDLWEGSEDENSEGERLAHDRWFFFLASVLGSVVYLPQVFADYRQHERNTYGWTAFSPGWHARLLGHVRQDGRSFRRRSRAAEARAAVLEQIALRTDDPQAARALAGAAAFRELAARWRLRASLYEAPTVADRVRGFVKLLRNGAYGAAGWKFGHMGFALDSLIGLTGLHPRPGTTHDKDSRVSLEVGVRDSRQG